jgi:hypothetical protein
VEQRKKAKLAAALKTQGKNKFQLQGGHKWVKV